MKVMAVLSDIRDCTSDSLNYFLQIIFSISYLKNLIRREIGPINGTSSLSNNAFANVFA